MYKVCKVYKVYTAALLAVLCAGCFATAPFETAETATQQFYAAQGSYNIALGLAVAYAESPTASLATIATIKEVEAVAYDTIQAAHFTLLRSTGMSRDNQLLVYATILAALAVRLETALAGEIQ